ANPTQLPANGLGGADNELFFFGAPVDYLDGVGQNLDAQGTLFVEPRFDPATGALLMGAAAIATNLTSLMSVLDVGGFTTALDFFKAKGIDLCARDRIESLGD